MGYHKTLDCLGLYQYDTQQACSGVCRSQQFISTLVHICMKPKGAFIAAETEVSRFCLFYDSEI